MSFFKEIRSHLATFETKSKADVENFIAHLEEVFKEHNITAISHAHKSSAPPTAVAMRIFKENRRVTFCPSPCP